MRHFQTGIMTQINFVAGDASLPSRTKGKEKLPYNQIIPGDCIEVMAGWRTGSVRMVVASPPYNLRNSSGNGMKNGNGGKWPAAALQNGYAGHDDCMPHDEYVAWQRACLDGMMRLFARMVQFSTITGGGFKTACIRIAPILSRGFLCVKSSSGTGQAE